MLFHGISEIFGKSEPQEHAALRLPRCQLKRAAHAGLQISQIPAFFEEGCSTPGELRPAVDKFWETATFYLGESNSFDAARLARCKYFLDCVECV